MNIERLHSCTQRCRQIPLKGKKIDLNGKYISG